MEAVSVDNINLLDNLTKELGLAIDWTAENVVPYLKDLTSRLVSYELITSVFLLLFSILLGVISYKLIKKTYRWYKNKSDEFNNSAFSDDPVLILVFMFPFMLLCFIAVCVFVQQINDIICCFTIPEKIVYDALMALNSK